MNRKTVRAFQPVRTRNGGERQDRESQSTLSSVAQTREVINVKKVQIKISIDLARTEPQSIRKVVYVESRACR